MRPWSAYCTAVTVLIVVFLMIPAAFGLENFTQWGGMYTNAWCIVKEYSGNPIIPGAKGETITAGLTADTRTVWYGTQHNEETCAIWAKTRCGQVSSNGWRIAWVVPNFKERDFLGSANACDLPVNASLWFPHAPSSF